jgi:hypothetical protein
VAHRSAVFPSCLPSFSWRRFHLAHFLFIPLYPSTCNLADIGRGAFQCRPKKATHFSPPPAIHSFRRPLSFLSLSLSAEYPWQVAILKKDEFDNVYICGGSLIDGSHIITAAHCVDDFKPHEIRYVTMATKSAVILQMLTTPN